MWSGDGAKRSRKDYFLGVKKFTIPVGINRKCFGKCKAFGSLVRRYSQDRKDTFVFVLSEFQLCTTSTKQELECMDL